MDFRWWGNWIMQERTGGLAIVGSLVVVVGGVVLIFKNLVGITKDRAGVPKELAELKKIRLEGKKIKADLRKPANEKLIERVSTILDNASHLHSELFKIFAPLAYGPPAIKKLALSRKLEAIREFQILQTYRPKIVAAISELAAMTGEAGDPDIEKLRKCATDFCERVGHKECYVLDIKKAIDETKGSQSHLDPVITADMRKWILDLRELHKELPPLVGSISGRVAHEPNHPKSPS